MSVNGLCTNKVYICVACKTLLVECQVTKIPKAFSVQVWLATYVACCSLSLFLSMFFDNKFVQLDQQVRVSLIL